MIKIKQTIFSDHDNNIYGNCLSACLASLLELGIEGVPIFVNGDNFWFERLWNWLGERGLELEVSYISEEKDFEKDKYYIVCGLAERGLYHSVIYYNGEMVHDPHFSNSGLLKQDRYWSFCLKNKED